MVSQPKCRCHPDEAQLQRKRSTPVSVSQPDDAAEQQADRIAQQVVRPGAGPVAERVSSVQPQLQAQCASCADGPKSTAGDHGPQSLTAEAAIPASGGHPLEAHTQRKMAERLSFDFSRVRIFSDSQASRLADSLDARAYTLGPNIVFGAGQYAPGTPEGDFLVAHELVHVAQQRRDVVQRLTKEALGPLPHPNRGRPKLCLWQVDHGSSIPRRARHKAAEISAVAVETRYQLDEADCRHKLPVGAVPFASGSQIINAIRNASLCTGQPVAEVHLFSHSSWMGLYAGGGHDSKRGLYRQGFSGSASALWRERGARSIADLPLDSLADDVVFVLHGCNAAMVTQDDADPHKNFAGELEAHLSSRLKAPTVYGHSTGVTCGSYANWMEYSVAFPGGRRVPSNPYHRRRSEQ